MCLVLLFRIRVEENRNIKNIVNICIIDHFLISLINYNLSISDFTCMFKETLVMK